MQETRILKTSKLNFKKQLTDQIKSAILSKVGPKNFPASLINTLEEIEIKKGEIEMREEIKNTIWNELLTDTSTTFSGDIFSDSIGYVISQDFIEKVEIEDSEDFNIILHYTTKQFQEYFEEFVEEFMWKVEREEIEEITEDYIRSFVLNYGEEFIFCDYEFISKTFDFDARVFGLEII